MFSFSMVLSTMSIEFFLIKWKRGSEFLDVILIMNSVDQAILCWSLSELKFIQIYLYQEWGLFDRFI